MKYPLKKVFITQKFGGKPEVYKQFGLNCKQVFVIFREFWRDCYSTFSKKLIWYKKNLNNVVIIQTDTTKKINISLSVSTIEPPPARGLFCQYFPSLALSEIKIRTLYIYLFLFPQNIKMSTKWLFFATKKIYDKFFPFITFTSRRIFPNRVSIFNRKRTFAFKVSDIKRLFYTFLGTIQPPVRWNNLRTNRA